MMLEVVFTLCVLLILPVVYHGWRPVVMALCTVLACALCEVLFSLIQRTRIEDGDFSTVITGLVITLLMPLNAPLWLPAAAGAFAILVAKRPFGGTGRNPFNPAAAGVAFVTICWPDKVFSYLNPSAAGQLPLFADCAVELVKSPAAMLHQGFKPDIVPLQMLWGNFAGPIGTTAILIIAACGFYLLIRRTIRWETVAAFFVMAALVAALFPRYPCAALTSVKYELMSGSLLFCGVFMVTDPVTSPRTMLGRAIYGAFAGLLVMGFRHFGEYEQGACFALLVANAAVPVIDRGVCAMRTWGGKAHEK